MLKLLLFFLGLNFPCLSLIALQLLPALMLISNCQTPEWTFWRLSNSSIKRALALFARIVEIPVSDADIWLKMGLLAVEENALVHARGFTYQPINKLGGKALSPKLDNFSSWEDFHNEISSERNFIVLISITFARMEFNKLLMKILPPINSDRPKKTSRKTNLLIPSNLFKSWAVCK